MLFLITSFVYFTSSLIVLVKQNAWIPSEKPLETCFTFAPDVKKGPQKGKLFGIHMKGKLSIGIIERF